MRILITGVGGPAGASLGLQARERGHEVIGVDMADTMTTRIADGFHTVPAATAPDAMTALARAGATVPETFDGMPTGDGPWVIKPRRSRGGRGVQVVEESAGIELHCEFELIQEFVPGDEYCPQVYRCPDSGEVTVVVLEKLELREGIVRNALGVRRCDDPVRRRRRGVHGQDDSRDARHLPQLGGGGCVWRRSPDGS